jgi:hypothetical protein
VTGPVRLPCGYCRKLAYLTRGAAEAAARIYHPAERLAVYRCGDGGRGWHLGHPDVVPSWPEWFDADTGRPCGRCPTVIGEGEPVAWLREAAAFVCFDCGDRVEQAVLAAT